MQPASKPTPRLFIATIDNLPPVDSTLEVPSGTDPDQNAWLTLTLRYRLYFADAVTPHGVVQQVNGKAYVADSDHWLYPIRNWNVASIQKFRKLFQSGEKIWNFQFLLRTPRNYAELDYDSYSGRGWTVRPNVLCLFRMQAEAVKPHLTIRVIRLDRTVTHVAKLNHPHQTKAANYTTFRSNRELYTDVDVSTPTLGHELGHALGQPHIMNLKGNQPCIAAAQHGEFPDHCYGHTPEERANIMGKGTRIYLINARPWQDRILRHTSGFGYGPPPQDAWAPTGIMKTPPRKIPMGVSAVGAPAEF